MVIKSLKNKFLKKFFFSLHVYFIIIVMAELLAVLLLAMGLTYLLFNNTEVMYKIPALLSILIVSMMIGTTFSVFLSKRVLAPITKLSAAMKNVASGDFSIRLKTNSKIEEISQLYSSFNVMARDLGATEIMQSDFVSNVSHEIKTPVAAIEGYATLLQDKQQTEEERSSCVDRILFNTRRLSQLVGNILLLSKVENGRMQSRISDFRLDEQIRQSIVALESKWVEKDIDFDIDMDVVEFVGAESLLMHVWNNIIGNAIKFSPQGGVVAIKLRDCGDKVTAAIQDAGPGIDEETRKHIFDKFYQGDSSRRAEGNGLGLSLVKRILDNCGGRVKAENAPEGGSVFTVELTRAKVQEPQKFS